MSLLLQLSPELGYCALLLAALVAALQAVAGIAAGLNPARIFMAALAKGAARAQFLAIAVAFAALVAAHMTSDFSVLNVVANSNSHLPPLYKFAGSWGSHEGSMLLWVLVLAVFGLLLPPAAGAAPEKSALSLAATGVQGIIGFSFLLFIILTSNPFLRVLPPAPEGQDLNPILQDPALAFHPPLLYLGYVGFSSLFSLAAAGLLTGRIDRDWARLVRPYAIGAWALLTLGITLGSHWAYTELGWGGWWFWDPVENAALMPWLAGTALLHALIVLEKRGHLKDWTAFLALLAFVLSLIGTFLVRSGVITSVHAFANDPSRGIFILLLLAVLAGGAFALFAIRAGRQGQGEGFALISRESAFVLNNLLLAAIAATVAIGTLYPYILQLITGSMISVGPPYFNITVIPLAVPLMILMAVAPRLAWQRTTLATLGPLLRRTLLASVLLGALLMIWQTGWPLAAWPFLLLAVAIMLGAMPEREGWRHLLRQPRRLGMMMAHIGFGVALLGMAGDSMGKEERTLALGPGDGADLAGYRITLDRLQTADGPNYRAAQALFSVRRLDDPQGAAFQMLSARHFYAGGQDVTAPAIHTTGLSDLYIAMGDLATHDGKAKDGESRIGFRLSYHPLIPLLWGGAGLMVLGAALAGLEGFASLLRRARSMPPQPQDHPV